MEVASIECDPFDVLHNNKYYQKKFPGFYVPTKDWTDRMWATAHNSYDYAQAQKEALLLKQSILDEDLPYRIDLQIKGESRWNGGRIMDTFLLGRIKYWEANSELMEAATHDLNEYMREESLEALGWMEDKSFAQASGIVSILIYDKSMWVKKTAAKVLGKIGNKIATPYLRDSIDEILPFILEYEIQGYPFCGDDKNKKKEMESALFLLENSIVSLFKLDSAIGREVLTQALVSPSNHAKHYAKRASFWVGNDP